MTDTDDIQQELFRDPRLVSDYTRYWEPNGFSYDAFLRWRKVHRGASVWNSIGHYPVLSERIIEEMGLCHDDGNLLDPEWANIWADYFPGPYEAVKWSSLTWQPSHAFHMKRLGYREPHRARVMYSMLEDREWMPVVEDRSDLRFPIPNPSVISTSSHTDIDWARKVTALYLSPTFRFSPGQVKALAQYIDVNMRSMEGLTSIVNVLLMIKHRGWPIPDGDGLFSFIVGNAEGWGSVIDTVVIQAADSHEDFISMLTLLKDIEHPYRGDVAAALYSIRTGVPMEWVTEDIATEVECGRMEGISWVPTASAPTHIIADPLNFLVQEMDIEARRLKIEAGL